MIGPAKLAFCNEINVIGGKLLDQYQVDISAAASAGNDAAIADIGLLPKHLAGLLWAWRAIATVLGTALGPSNALAADPDAASSSSPDRCPASSRCWRSTRNSGRWSVGGAGIQPGRECHTALGLRAILALVPRNGVGERYRCFPTKVVIAVEAECANPRVREWMPGKLAQLRSLGSSG
jgi:hypothetical protein